MGNETAQVLKEKIAEYQNIIIAKHITPDWDAVGSAQGLRLIIQSNFKNKNVYVVGKDINNIKTIDDNKLTPQIISESLLITVDTANVERLDFEAFKEVKESFRVDHHLRNDTSYTNYEYIYEDAIACTQVITLWAHETKLAIPKNAAEFLYRGLLTDSNRFAFQNTNENSFLAAQILVKSGVIVDEITNDIYKRTYKQALWNARAFQKITYDPNYQMAYLVVKNNDVKKYSLSQTELSSALGTMGGIVEFDVWFMIYQYEKDGDIKVSLRSKKIDINKFAIRFGGGGHKLASGAKLSSWDQLDNFILEFKKYLKGEE